MNKSKTFRDPVYKDIFLSRLEVKVIDTPVFQRLRRIKQLGVTNLVYPGANHTRFEHSIGAANIAGRIVKRLDIGELKEEIKIAALLHDLGHGPLSHTSEEILKKHLGSSHEDNTLRLIRESEVSDILSENSIDLNSVVKILSKKNKFSSLISGEVDVDRMDYLSRDAYHTGVAYGIIDLDRIINNIELLEGKFVVNQGGLRAVEGMLVARFLMTPTVYLHHTSRIVDTMFLRATEMAIETGIVELENLYSMDDVDMQCLFRCATGYVKDIGRRIDERRLFKTVWRLEAKEMDDEFRGSIIKLLKDVKRWDKIEKELAEDAKLEPGYVILDVPPRLKYEESMALMFDGKKTERLDALSPIVKIIKETEDAQWNVAIYAPGEHLEKVSRVCAGIREFLH